MLNKIKKCICCKIAVSRKKYCENCGKYIEKLISRIRTNNNLKIKKLKDDLERKYNYIGRIKESMNNNKKL